MSGIARKTGWMLAEQAGAERPFRMQSLLGRSCWEAGGTLADPAGSALYGWVKLRDLTVEGSSITEGIG